jgi:hypothetical protein
VELLATSEPLRSDRSGLPTSRLAEGNPISTYLDTHHLQLPSGTDPPGQLIDDRAAGHDRPAEPLHHGGQARARSGGRGRVAAIADVTSPRNALGFGHR